GKLTEPAWKGDPQAVLPFTKAQLFARYDSGNLYLAIRRPAVSRKGKVASWVGKTTGEDADIQQDDSVEVFLSDSEGAKVVHLGVSASGARFDARSDDSARATESREWNGPWQSAVSADENG